MPLQLKDIYSKQKVSDIENSEYIFEQNVTVPRVTGRGTGGVLRANLYRPHDDAKYPTLVTCGPYGKDWHYSTYHPGSYQQVNPSHKSLHSAWETPSPNYWTTHGYAVLRVDEAGIGQSPGRLNVLSEETTDAYQDAIEWAAVQPWSNGKVGLLGVSYYGATQWMVAARRPKGLEAMIPWEGFSDLFRDCIRHGGILSSGFLEFWWNYSVRGNQYGYGHPEENPHRPLTQEGILSDKELEENRFDIRNMGHHQFLDDSGFESRVPDLSKVVTPVLSVANWGGIGLHLRGNVMGFMSVASPFKYLRFIDGRHDLPFYITEEVETQRSFLDAFLKGDDRKGWSEPGKLPPVDMSVRKGDPSSDTVFERRLENEWPLARTEYEKWHLCADKSIAKAGDVVSSQGTLEYPALDGAVWFSTAPMSSDIEITGHATLRLAISVDPLPGSDTTPTEIDVFATLRHIDASGKHVSYLGSFGEPTPIVRGWLRASHRAVDENHPLSQHLAVHKHTKDAAQEVKIGHVYQIDVEFWPTSVVVEQGGRLVLELAACDDPVGSAYPKVGVWTHNDPDDRPAEKFRGLNRVHFSESHENWLLLPVIPAGADRATAAQ